MNKENQKDKMTIEKRNEKWKINKEIKEDLMEEQTYIWLDNYEIIRKDECSGPVREG